MIEVGFRVEMKKRFLDTGFAEALGVNTRVFFAVAGSAVMTASRRLLKMARKQKLSDLTRLQQIEYKRAQKRFRKNPVGAKPKLGTKGSKPGNPPSLHSKNSLLKRRLFFALAPDKRSVVIGPELVGRNARLEKQKRRGISSIAELEERFPFVEPGLQLVLPRIPSYVEKAMKKRG